MSLDQAYISGLKRGISDKDVLTYLGFLVTPVKERVEQKGEPNDYYILFICNKLVELDDFSSLVTFKQYLDLTKYKFSPNMLSKILCTACHSKTSLAEEMCNLITRWGAKIDDITFETALHTQETTMETLNLLASHSTITDTTLYNAINDGMLKGGYKISILFIYNHLVITTRNPRQKRAFFKKYVSIAVQYKIWDSLCILPVTTTLLSELIDRDCCEGILPVLNKSRDKSLTTKVVYTAAVRGKRNVCYKLASDTTEFNIILAGASLSGHLDICNEMIKRGANDYTIMLIMGSIGGHPDICKLAHEKNNGPFGLEVYKCMYRLSTNSSVTNLAIQWSSAIPDGGSRFRFYIQSFYSSIDPSLFKEIERHKALLMSAE